MKKILVTGAAGFIGFHLCKRLLKSDFEVIAVDSLDDYYDVGLKTARIDYLIERKGEDLQSARGSFAFYKENLIDKEKLLKLFIREQFNYVIHLAAQAGVRYSLQNPQAYIDSNIQGFLNILEACRSYTPEHLLFASSSSAYGLNRQIPFSTKHHTDHPVSLYAATKKAGEMMAHAYAHLFQIPCTGLRFFTVYGPWGRPDMAYFSFTSKIFAGEPIEVFNNGEMMRDFTYIEDIVDEIVSLVYKAPEPNGSFDAFVPDPSFSSAPFRILNIGNNTRVRLMDFIRILEETIGINAVKVFKPMQSGDVYATFADIEDLTNLTGFRPTTPVEAGLRQFVDWFRDYYKP